MQNIPRYSLVRSTSIGDFPESKPSTNVTKYSIFPKFTTAPATILRLPDSTESEIGFDQHAASSQSVGEIGFYDIPEATMLGPAFVFSKGRLIDEPDLIPQYVRSDLDNGTQWDFKPDLPTRYVPGTSIVAVSNAYFIYGHWLVDILPRIWLAETFLSQNMSKRYIIPRGTPEYAVDIMENFFEIKNYSYHEINNENLCFERAIVPSLLHNDHFFHWSMNEFVRYCIERAKHFVRGPKMDILPTRLYINRSSFRKSSSSYRRQIVNENQVLDCVQKAGLSIIEPENLSWIEQIVLFSRAELIVGESGSGLHNAVFSPAGTTVICINPVNHLQTTIASLRQQNIMTILTERFSSEGGLNYQVDIGRLSESIKIASESAAHNSQKP